MYSFAYDPEQNLLRLVQGGYWDLAEFRAFEQELLSLHAQIRANHASYRVLADCKDYPVQSVDISDAFARLFARLMAQNHGRYAIIAASVLNKMQARRAIPQSNVEIFLDEGPAMAWLRKDAERPA